MTKVMIINVISTLLSSDIVQTIIISLLLSFIGWLGLRWRWTRQVMNFAIEAYYYAERKGLRTKLKGYEKFGPFMNKFIDSYFDNYGKYPDHKAKGIAVREMEKKVKAERPETNKYTLLCLLPLVLVFFISTPSYAGTVNTEQPNSVYMTVLIWLLGAAVGIIGYFLKDLRRTIEAKNQEQDDNIQEARKEIIDLKTSMPRNYVMKDDYLREIAYLGHKVDKISFEISELNKNVSKMLGGEK